jgi:hypothetical protein
MKNGEPIRFAVCLPEHADFYNPRSSGTRYCTISLGE